MEIYDGLYYLSANLQIPEFSIPKSIGLSVWDNTINKKKIIKFKDLKFKSNVN